MVADFRADFLWFLYFSHINNVFGQCLFSFYWQYDRSSSHWLQQRSSCRVQQCSLNHCLSCYDVDHHSHDNFFGTYVTLINSSMCMHVSACSYVHVHVPRDQNIHHRSKVDAIIITGRTNFAGLPVTFSWYDCHTDHVCHHFSLVSWFFLFFFLTLPIYTLITLIT